MTATTRDALADVRLPQQSPFGETDADWLQGFFGAALNFDPRSKETHTIIRHRPASTSIIKNWTSFGGRWEPLDFIPQKFTQARAQELAEEFGDGAVAVPVRGLMMRMAEILIARLGTP